jgi:hypothetical protein
MSIRSACVIGCCVTASVLLMLFGINGIVRSKESVTERRTTQQYNIPGNCTLKAIYSGRSDDDDSCTVWRYSVDVGPLTPGGEPLGMKLAFGNFFPSDCGGVQFDHDRIDTAIDCWIRSADDPFVRVSPIHRHDTAYLVAGVICVTVASVAIMVFLLYNLVLWLGVCADIGPFARSRRAVVVGSTPAAADAATQGDPFDLGAITVADQSWIRDVAFNNAYAKAVIRRFGHDASFSQSAAPPATGGAPAEASSPMVTEVAPEPLIAEGMAQPPYGTSYGATGHVAVVHRAEALTGPPECCVCWEPIEDEAVVFPCVHTACKACVERMIARATATSDMLLACPMCRRNAFQAELRRLPRKGDDHPSPGGGIDPHG